MTTTIAPTATRRPSQGTYDRVFYTGLASLMALTVLAGFGGTYYLTRKHYSCCVPYVGSATP